MVALWERVQQTVFQDYSKQWAQKVRNLCLYLIKEKLNLMKQDIEKEKDELNQLKIQKIDMDTFFN